MKLIFNEDAVVWLKENGLSDKEIEDAERMLTIAVKNMEKSETTVGIPDDTPMKVAAVVYSVLTTFSEDTITEKFVSISREARTIFGEEMQIEELETTIGKVGRIKLGRRYSTPKRKSSIKKDRTHPE